MPRYIAILVAFLSLCFAAQAVGDDSFTDPRDGQDYKILQIGKQVWMAENLNYKSANSWCYANKDSNCEIYGRLYTWETARKVCPAGWHLPKREEWFDLHKAIEREPGPCACCSERSNREWFAGKKLKSKSQWNGTDDFGFSALPGGMRYYNQASFRSAGSFGHYWVDNRFNSQLVYFWTFRTGRDEVEEGIDYSTYGFSVRCVIDKLVPDSLVREAERPIKQSQRPKCKPVKNACVFSDDYSECRAVRSPSMKAPSMRDVIVSKDASRSKQEITQLFNSRLPGLENVYNKYAKEKPGLRGKITLEFVIAPSGDVTDVLVVSSTTGYSEFDAAIKNMVGTWKWKSIECCKMVATVPLEFKE